MASHPGEGRAVRRLGPDGRPQFAHSWESLIERQIREAAEAGDFDNLPFQGEPLPNDENPHAGDWGLAFRMLRSAGYAPPWIEADKEARELLAKREAILARAADGPAPTSMARRRARAILESLVPDINAAIARVNAEAPTDRQRRQPLNLATELARFDEACER